MREHFQRASRPTCEERGSRGPAGAQETSTPVAEKKEASVVSARQSQIVQRSAGLLLLAHDLQTDHQALWARAGLAGSSNEAWSANLYCKRPRGLRRLRFVPLSKRITA